MQNHESDTAAERPNLLTVKNVKYVGSIKQQQHGFELAEVKGHVLDGKPVVDISIGSGSRDLTIDEAHALGLALLGAVAALS
ncbi:MAG TPA: hypothetical protein VFM56_10645 [Solimonas sp.]|nr:hypothetical protein [Solimonas sp.]